MKWVNVLHLYQPPTQTKEIVDAVVRESYQKIVSLLDEYLDLKLTLNVAGSLLELLEKYGHDDVIAGIRKHAERGAVELMGSAMYHPILPLLSEKEIRRQIDLHDKISKRCFGKAYAPRGFYFPEMAYSATAAEVVAEAGFQWTILDEVHSKEPIDPAIYYVINGIGKKASLAVLFRSSRFSKTFPPEAIVEGFVEASTEENGGALITCHDGELYGHWHKDDRGYYKKAFTHSDIIMSTASEYLTTLALVGDPKEIAIRDASWESTTEELAQDISLGLWNHPDNDIHQLLEVFKRRILIVVENHQDDPGYEQARHHADKGVASCAWWWASERRLGPFSPLTWNPTEIQKGAHELYTALKSLSTINAEEVAEVESIFRDIQNTVWTKHRKKYDPSYPQ